MPKVDEIVSPALVATSPMQSGLGNRLPLVLSAQSIADVEGRTFYYHWPVGEENGKRFGARFDELWEYSGGIAIDEPGPTPAVEFFSQRGFGSLEPVRGEPVISVIGNGALPQFGGSRHWSNMLPELRPTEEVRGLITEPLSSLGRNFIGVQVRAHPTLTHQKTLAESPVEWFIARMLAIREERPEARFYLSSDVSSAEERIREAVPGVVSLPKEGEYNSREGLIESVADLVILSRSQRIIAPYVSSFAKVAWHMARRRIPFETSMEVLPAKQ